MGGLGVLLDDGTVEVAVYVDLRHDRRSDISQVEATGLGAERRPTRCTLAVDCVCVISRRSLVSLGLSVLDGREVKDVEANTRIGSKDGVSTVNIGHGKGQKTASGGTNLGEVGGQGTILRDIPNSKKTGVSRGCAFDRRDKLVSGLVEDDVTRGVRRASGWGGLVEIKRALRVGDRLEALGARGVASDNGQRSA